MGKFSRRTASVSAARTLACYAERNPTRLVARVSHIRSVRGPRRNPPLRPRRVGKPVPTLAIIARCDRGSQGEGMNQRFAGTSLSFVARYIFNCDTRGLDNEGSLRVALAVSRAISGKMRTRRSY